MHQINNTANINYYYIYYTNYNIPQNYPPDCKHEIYNEKNKKQNKTKNSKVLKVFTFPAIMIMSKYTQQIKCNGHSCLSLPESATVLEIKIESQHFIHTTLSKMIQLT